MDSAAVPAAGTEADSVLPVVVDPTSSLDDSAPAVALVSFRYQPLVPLTLAVAAGIIADRFGPRKLFPGPIVSERGDFWFLAIWCSCAAMLVAWLWLWRRRYDGLAACSLIAAAALAGSDWHELNWFVYDADEIGRYARFDPMPVCIEAVATESPERVAAPPPTPLRAVPVGERSRMVVDVVRIRDGRNWRPASGTCQFSVDGHLLGVHAGDQLRIFGRLSRISPPLNPGQFDFAARARADRNLVRIRSSVPECVTTLATGTQWSIAGMLDTIRNSAKQRVRKLIGAERAGLAAAILLGAREGLPYEQTESYLVTGTIHVLVVSGMNVAILATGFFLMMRLGLMNRRTGLVLIVLVVVTYALMAELQPPVMRAAVLGVLLCLSTWLGRSGVAFNSLFAAALVVVAINPNDLFGAGPQLSFLAVGVLIWIGAWLSQRNAEVDPLDQLIASTRPWPVRFAKKVRQRAWEFGLVTVVIWLTALPLVLYQFHILSPIAIVISPLVWLFMFLAMWSGFFMLVAGWLVPVIGTLCAAICNVSLAGLDSLVRWAEAAPFGHAWLPGPAWWWVATFYLGLLVVMIWGRSLLAPRWQLATLAVWILVGLMPFMLRGRTRDGFYCTVVAVGHGECVVLEAPNGQTFLYDAGAMGAPEYATQTIAGFLWSRGIMRIDGIILSHSDTDHYNAVPGLLDRFRVGAVYVSSVMFREVGNSRNSGPKVLKESMERAGVPIREVWSGDQLHVGPDVTIQIFHPPRKGILGTDNANSVTVGVEYAGRRILLPGDLESPGIDDVMAEEPYHCDIVLAPHHGSRRSDPPGFAAWSRPNWLVLSGPGGELVAPVIRTYESEGAHAVVTEEAGAVEFKVRPDSTLSMSTWRTPRPVADVYAEEP